MQVSRCCTRERLDLRVDARVLVKFPLPDALHHRVRENECSAPPSRRLRIRVAAWTHRLKVVQMTLGAADCWAAVGGARGLRLRAMRVAGMQL